MSTLSPNGHMILDSLPTEIQDVIFHYVVFDSSGDQLKQLRRCNRYFRDRADIYLFHTLHISASTASLERIRQVAESDRLSVHVRELVFHRGTFFGHKMARAVRIAEVNARAFDDFETYVVQSNTKEVRKEIIFRVSECYANFIEELQYESRFNQDMTWRSTLRKPCSRFTRLEKLTTVPARDDLESEYLRKRCGMTYQTWTPNYFAPYEIFEVCGRNFKPKALDMEDVNGEDFASIVSNIRGGPTAVANRFSDLKYLRLSFSETVISLEVDGTWDLFIQSCTNLRSLWLDFTIFLGPRVIKEPESFPRRLLKLVCEQTFPHLSSLTLICGSMTEEGLVNFLERHRQTLTELKLFSWYIPVDAAELPTGSTIRAFWKIGKMALPKLQSVQLQGEFSNRSDTLGWAAEHYSTNTPITSNFKKYIKEYGLTTPQLEAYMSNSPSESSPWPFFRIDAATMEGAKTSKQLAELDRLPYDMQHDDMSFTWWNSGSERRNEHIVD